MLVHPKGVPLLKAAWKRAANVLLPAKNTRTERGRAWEQGRRDRLRFNRVDYKLEWQVSTALKTQSQATPIPPPCACVSVKMFIFVWVWGLGRRDTGHRILTHTGLWRFAVGSLAGNESFYISQQLRWPRPNANKSTQISTRLVVQEIGVWPKMLLGFL